MTLSHVHWRLAGFLAAIVVLLGKRVFLPSSHTEKELPGHEVGQWSLWQLLVASFLTLFTELALIRWIGTEVRVFAYVKNLALLLCFLGFGLGCALAKCRVRWWGSATALLGLLMVVRIPWRGEELVEGLSQALGAAQDVEIWATGTVRNWPQFLIAAALTTLVLLMITFIFVPLGQVVSRQIELAPRVLLGYSWNLGASLAGILVFFGVCRYGLPPSLWFATALLGVAVLQSSWRERVVLASFVVPVLMLLHETSTPKHFSLWTPYQQIEVEEQDFPSGEFGRATVKVNHTGYQMISNLSAEFLARHPHLLSEPPAENPYNLPFRFSIPAPRVLIVGSGAGNDVAAAVRNGGRSVDAIEIDPAILSLGLRHPEHPYQSPLVNAHVTDARAFMKRAHGSYDLVLFGLLDSHTQLSDYANMRIDNFVYTEQSFREARTLLSPNGVLFVKFQINHPWLGRRLVEMMTEVFGKPPLVFFAGSSYTAGATCFVISPSDQVSERMAADANLNQFVSANRPTFLELPAVEITTDDWPYLYQRGRWIPGIFFSVSVLVMILAGILYRQIPEARQTVPSLFFFSMGAGFLLLEAQVVSRLALYFGTTWQVNGIVIAAILIALLAANAVVEKLGSDACKTWPLAGLLTGLLLAYLIPFNRIPGSANFVGWVAAAIFSIPVFFAGVLFATQFQKAERPSAALGANMLGAVVGGLLENLSLVVGLKALVLIALAWYALAGWALRRESSMRLQAKVRC